MIALYTFQTDFCSSQLAHSKDGPKSRSIEVSWLMDLLAESTSRERIKIKSSSIFIQSCREIGKVILHLNKLNINDKISCSVFILKNPNSLNQLVEELSHQDQNLAPGFSGK